MEYAVESGVFEVMVGRNSAEGVKGKFRVLLGLYPCRII